MPIIIHSCALSFTVFILIRVEGRKPSFRLKAPEIVQRGRRGERGGVRSPVIGATVPHQRELRPDGNSSRTIVRLCEHNHSVSECHSGS